MLQAGPHLCKQDIVSPRITYFSFLKALGKHYIGSHILRDFDIQFKLTKLLNWLCPYDLLRKWNFFSFQKAKQSQTYILQKYSHSTPHYISVSGW